MAKFRKDGSVDLRRLPKIVERPLHRHGADGMATQLLHTEPGEKAPVRRAGLGGQQVRRAGCARGRHGWRAAVAGQVKVE